MPSPFAALVPALGVLATEGRVLPATGQAIVDGVRPDIEELYDRATGGDAVSEGLWEHPRASMYHRVPQIQRHDQHVFRYFTDGSTKTYFIGTVLEHERSSPIQLAQVGAAGVRRDDDGSLRTASVRHELAGLDEGHRTAVFPRRRGDRSQLIAFWYVRLRPQRQLDYPLMGVVKVEIPCSDGEPLDSDLADLISGALIAERSVTPHGQDSRWHAHLYPIWIAERVIRDSFYSEEVLKAAIRWPDPQEEGAG